MVHPYYDNYPTPYYQIHHHFLSRFVLLALSIAMIVMAILDYVYVYQTWYTYTINAVTIFAGICGILSSIFVSFTLLEFSCLLFFALFGVQLASLIYRAVVGIEHSSRGYGITMCAVLLVAWLVTTHLIRWFHAEIITGTYAAQKAAGGGATTNVAITQPQQQPMGSITQPHQQPMVQPSNYGQTTTPTGGPGLGTQYGTDPSYGQSRTYAPAPQLGTYTPNPNNTYTTGGTTGGGLTGPPNTTGGLTGGPSAAYPQQRTYPAGTVQV